MGLFSRFENKAEDVIEGSGSSGRGGLEPVKIAKRACKEMEREKMVGVGHEYAPTLYNILVSTADDGRMSGYYPSLAGEIETYLTSRAEQANLTLDCPPLVRFIVDDNLKRGKFDIIAESVSPAIIEELRHEEMVRYGLEEQEPLPGDNLAARSYGNPYGNDAFAPGTGPYAGFDDVSYTDIVGRQQPREPLVQPPAEPVPGADRTVILGQARPQAPHAQLVNKASGEVFDLKTDRTSIGRDMNCDVTVLDPSVSRRHAEVLHSESGWLIHDVGSTNGTSVNGAMTTQTRIYNGDVIDLGKTQLEFRED